MPYDFNIYHSQVTPLIPDYDTVTVITSSDLQNYATIPYVNSYGDSKYLSLNGGILSGDLILNNLGGIAKRLVLNSANGIPISVQAGITFVSALTSETGIIVPGLLITDGRLDITPDPTFNRAEFRIKGDQTQFNIFNINTFDFYMRVNSDTSFMVGRNTVALSAGSFACGVNTLATNGGHAEGVGTVASGNFSHAEGESTTASGYASHAEGTSTVASGNFSHAEGQNCIALGDHSHAAGRTAAAVHDSSWIWRGNNLSTVVPVSTTRTEQFMVSARGGISLHNRVGIGTDSIANALTVVGEISATRTIYSSGAPVVVSSPIFETPTTNISSISNIVAVTQATYNALTVKLPTTLYVIV